jgi:GNAT superfamily N-acetyltransferase
MVRVRTYTPDDRPFIFSLAPRLAIGRRPWRDLDQWRQAVEGWLDKSIAQHGQQIMLFIAEDEQAGRCGFATVTHSAHFTGQPQAYLGELAVRDDLEGQGIGTFLVEACEQWAREQGYSLLALTTGAANAGALGFYHHLGYQDEDVTLVKLLL